LVARSNDVAGINAFGLAIEAVNVVRLNSTNNPQLLALSVTGVLIRQSISSDTTLTIQSTCALGKPPDVCSGDVAGSYHWRWSIRSTCGGEE